MKKLFYFGTLICLALSAPSCTNSNTNDSCVIGKWSFNSPSSNVVPSCVATLEFKSNGKGNFTLDDCSNYCQNNSPMNFYTFTYSAENGAIDLKIDGKIKVCGADNGESDIATTGTYICVDQNTLKLSSLASNSQDGILTRVQ